MFSKLRLLAFPPIVLLFLVAGTSSLADLTRPAEKRPTAADVPMSANARREQVEERMQLLRRHLRDHNAKRATTLQRKESKHSGEIRR
ncbi:MAG: hypothetical protein ACI8TX_001889 [Hyphomicrobiaceae bacterium]|jgi:hypothetical protein